MSKKILNFVIRWLFNSMGLWIAVRLLGTGYDHFHVTVGVIGFLFAGLIFSIINTIFKPIFVILSLPAILLTFGLFIIVLNGLMVYITFRLTPGISMTFLNSILTGIIISLLNYIVSATLIIKSKST